MNRNLPISGPRLYHEDDENGHHKVISRVVRILYSAFFFVFILTLAFHTDITNIALTESKQMHRDADLFFLIASNNEFRKTITHLQRWNEIGESIIEDLKKENERLKTGQR